MLHLFFYAHHLFFFSHEKTETQKSPKPLQWVWKRVRFGHGSEKKQAEMEKRMAICRLKERYQNLETKDRRWDHLADQSDGYHMSRNSILKKSIF